ncbi:hypothetical protein QTV44_000030 [Vibrio vulnificus]|nr:hypothetical protein [Vibrio vulnificus]
MADCIPLGRIRRRALPGFWRHRCDPGFGLARFTLPDDNQQQWTYICDTNVRNVSPDVAKGEVLLSPVSMAILHYQPQESVLAKPKV